MTRLVVHLTESELESVVARAVQRALSSRDSGQVLNQRQAAAALGISRSKLYDLQQSGEISCSRIGRCVRYRVQDIADYMERQQRHGGS